jgi:hypothetical protein
MGLVVTAIPSADERLRPALWSMAFRSGVADLSIPG